MAVAFARDGGTAQVPSSFATAPFASGGGAAAVRGAVHVAVERRVAGEAFCITNGEPLQGGHFFELLARHYEAQTGARFAFHEIYESTQELEMRLAQQQPRIHLEAEWAAAPDANATRLLPPVDVAEALHDRGLTLVLTGAPAEQALAGVLSAQLAARGLPHDIVRSADHTLRVYV